MPRKPRAIGRYPEEDLEDQFNGSWELLAEKEDAREQVIERIAANGYAEIPSEASCRDAFQKLMGTTWELGALHGLTEIRTFEGYGDGEAKRVMDRLKTRANYEAADAKRFLNYCSRSIPVPSDALEQQIGPSKRGRGEE